MSVKISLRCPSCGTQKMVLVPKDHVKNKPGGTAILKIPTNMVCQHAFFAYIDKNFAVRDYLQPQYMLDDTQKHVRDILSSKLKDFSQIDINFKYLLTYISEIDLRSLVYACFIESPIIIIENDFEHSRFIMLLAILKNIFPDMLETCLFYTPEEYLNYSQEHPTEIEHFTIYNLAYKLSVHKPFLDHQSEPLQNRLNDLCLMNSKLELIQCKNKFDYLVKFSEFIVDFPLMESNKLGKLMKKKHPEHKVLFSNENIALMRDRLKFTHLLSFPDLSPSIGPIFIWNANIEKSQIESVSNLIEKLCLNAIWEHKEIAALDLIKHLQKFAVVKMAKLTPNSLLKLLKKYVKMGWVIKK